MSLKNEIERELGIPIRLRAGAPGSFNVLLNGRTDLLEEAGGAFTERI